MQLWRSAMARALYGDPGDPGGAGAAGFYTRAGDPGGRGGHFRTSATASPLFATALLRLAIAVDDALDHPDPFDLVDIAAGGGDLVRHIHAQAPAHLAARLRVCAVELAPRPVDLPDAIGWSDHLPPPGTVTGMVLATEWLDNVALQIAQAGPDGRLRYVLVDPVSGAEALGSDLTPEDQAWASRWWPTELGDAGVRVELGTTRDSAWAEAVATLARGVAVTVDYGHTREDRPPLGTLAGFRAGRSCSPVPDGSCDLTAHVAIDAVARAGAAIAATPAVVHRQRDALAALGLTTSRPPLSMASQDPARYLRSLSAAAQAGELMNANGLGGHYWIVQPVGLATPDLPEGLRGTITP